jgi:hypothetical protein
MVEFLPMWREKNEFSETQIGRIKTELVLAKAYLGLEDFEKAESNANSAYEKAVGMKYRWAEGKMKGKREKWKMIIWVPAFAGMRRRDERLDGLTPA